MTPSIPEDQQVEVPAEGIEQAMERFGDERWGRGWRLLDAASEKTTGHREAFAREHVTPLLQAAAPSIRAPLEAALAEFKEQVAVLRADSAKNRDAMRMTGRPLSTRDKEIRARHEGRVYGLDEALRALDAALADAGTSLDSIRQQAAEEERKRQERYAASEREEATRRLLKAEAERDQAAQQERERIEAALTGIEPQHEHLISRQAALATLKEEDH